MKYKKGLLTTVKDMNFYNFCEKFMDEYAEPNLSPTTIDGYFYILSRHLIPAFGSAMLRNIKPLHIDEYINEKRKSGKIKGEGGLSERTLLHHFRLLSKIFYQAKQWGIIEVNPIVRAKSPKPEDKEKKAYSWEQLKAMLNISKKTDLWTYRFILIDVFTGLRISEILGLQHQNIDTEKRLLSVREVLVKKRGKGSVFKKLPKSDTSRRTMLLPEILIPVFEEIFLEQKKRRLKKGEAYYRERNLVFCKDNGENYYPTTVNRKVNKIKRAAGIKDKSLNIHSLRHTHGTMLMEFGWPDRARQKRLGHYSSEITNKIYTHISFDYENKLVGIMEKEMKKIIK